MNRRNDGGGWAYPQKSKRVPYQPPNLGNNNVRKNTAVNNRHQPNYPPVQNHVNNNQHVPKNNPRNRNHINQQQRNVPRKNQQVQAQNPRYNPRQNSRKNQNRINPQSAAQRRKQNRTPAIDPETMEIRRRRQQAEKFRIKKRRESLMKVYFARFVAFLIVAAVMMTGVSVLMAIDFFKTEGVPNKITYIYGSDKNKNTVSADTARKNDIIFIDFSEIAEMLSMTVTGDVHKMRFVITSAGEPIFQPTLQSAETETLEETDSQTDTENTDTNANSNTETPADSTEVESAEWVTFEVGTTKAYVNGQEIRLSGESFLVGEKLWIPSDFIDVYMKGVTLSIDDEKGIVEFSRNVISDTNADEETQNSEENQSAIVYESVEFLLKDAGPIDPVSEEGFTEPAIEFKADLAEYEKYMNPENPDEYLILINVDNPLSSDYVPDDLIDVVNTRKDGRATQQMREAAEKSLEALFLEMHANNITDVSVTSGYRSYDYQVSLFNQRVAMYPNLSEEEARKEAAAVVAIPGTSEHQSGLCVDMHNLASADISFGNTASFTWLSQNAHKFGFILRFPEDKVEITGISYEPWHYRFVGRYHATRIYEMGMCLEEYFEYLGK